MTHLRLVANVLLSCLLATPALAQQPRIGNARLQTRPLAAGLDREFRALADQAGPLWVGYAAPVVSGDRTMCCFDSRDGLGGTGCCAGCQLERAFDRAQAGDRGGVNVTDPPQGPLRLERTHFAVLFRIEGHRVDRIRSFSLDCELDAGGLPVYWLEGVRPADSIALLTTFATGSDSVVEDARMRRVAEGAIGAVALHADPAADRAFERFIAPQMPERLRKRATFWLGSARGARGYELLRQVLRDDPSDNVREQASFGLSVSPEAGALETLIATARADRSSKVRGQALFWLAQKAGRRAAETITNAIENDPETDVKKRAVFALTQLPKDEGVPLLIQIARTNRNPAVRKQAMFWLGQSKDARAVAFFEEILLKK